MMGMHALYRSTSMTNKPYHGGYTCNDGSVVPSVIYCEQPTAVESPAVVPPEVSSHEASGGIAAILDRVLWSGSIPFGKQWPVWSHLLLVVVVAIFVIILLGWFIRAVVRMVSPERRRWRREVRHLRDDPPLDMMYWLASMDVNHEIMSDRVHGVRRARSQHLEMLRSSKMFPELVADLREASESRYWDDARADRMYQKYHVPLDVLADETRLFQVFRTAKLTYIEGGRIHTPTLRGLDESDQGLIAEFECPLVLTIGKWYCAVEVLSTALDSPGLRVTEINGGRIAVHLRDRDRRERAEDSARDIREALSEYLDRSESETEFGDEQTMVNVPVAPRNDDEQH